MSAPDTDAILAGGRAIHATIAAALADRACSDPAILEAHAAALRAILPPIRVVPLIDCEPGRCPGCGHAGSLPCKEDCPCD